MTRTSERDTRELWRIWCCVASLTSTRNHDELSKCDEKDIRREEWRTCRWSELRWTTCCAPCWEWRCSFPGSISSFLQYGHSPTNTPTDLTLKLLALLRLWFLFFESLSFFLSFEISFISFSRTPLRAPSPYPYLSPFKHMQAPLSILPSDVKPRELGGFVEKKLNELHIWLAMCNN